MASIPASAVASAATTSLAAQAGSFLVNLGASYLLSRVAAQDGPRLDNLAAGGGDYGVVMPRAFGEKVRLTGIFIAMQGIKETKHTVEDYSEIVGAATGALEGFMVGAKIGSVGGPLGAGIGAAVGGLLGFLAPNQHYYTYSDTFAHLVCDRAPAAPSASQPAPPAQDPVEGLAKAWAGGKVIFDPVESPVVSESLDTDGRLISRTYGKNRWFKSLTLHAGNAAQGVDPVLATAVGETGGYPFSAYVVIEDLQLAQFGNSVPAIEYLVAVKAGESLAGVAESIAGAAGIDPARDLSTTALAAMAVRGYAVTAQSTCWDALKPLLPAFGADAAEVAGQIRFYKRAQPLRSTIPLADLGAYAYGDSPPPRITFRRDPDLGLPKETSLTFIDPARDYQPNTATARRSEGDAQSNVTASVPLVLTATEGASAAALMHWDAWLGRTAAAFTLTDKWDPQPGLAYAIPGAGQFTAFRITRNTRGANGLREIEAVSDEDVTYSASVAGTSGTPGDGDSTLFADTRLVAMDMPILEDAHDDFGFYVAMAGTASYWERGAIQIMGTGGTNFATLVDSDLTDPAMGDVTGTLGAGSTTGLDDTLDTTSVLTVVLLHDGMALSSATDAELDANANFAFVGKNGQGEYLQWKTATRVAPKTWELTGLRRGRKGTDWAIGLHGAGEEFAQLGGEGVFRMVYSDDGKWGVPFELRGVTLHQAEADAAIVDFTNTGEGKRPYSPVGVEGVFDGSVNLTMTWTRRSRFTGGEIGTDAPEAYEIDVWNDAGTAVVRTIAASTPSAAYSAVDQASDGLSPVGGQITVDVYQVNLDYGRSHPRRAIFVGPNALPFDLEDAATPIHIEDGATILEMEAV